VDDHGPWSYHTVIATAHPALVAHEANDESKEVAWVAFDEVIGMNLHPSFANTWPKMLAKLQKL
jgi:8-oxo-dGTP diphosphatase